MRCRSDEGVEMYVGIAGMSPIVIPNAIETEGYSRKTSMRRLKWET